MTKADLAERIHTKIGLPIKESSDLLEAFIDIIKSTLESGEDIKITGFGKFKVKQKQARKGRNPQTGEAIMIDARQIVTFNPSGLLRQKVNK